MRDESIRRANPNHPCIDRLIMNGKICGGKTKASTVSKGKYELLGKQNRSERKRQTEKEIILTQPTK